MTDNFFKVVNFQFSFQYWIFPTLCFKLNSGSLPMHLYSLMYYSIFALCLFNVHIACLFPQLLVKITVRLWRCPSTLRRWGWFLGCALEVWSSSSFCWVLSSSSLRKGNVCWQLSSTKTCLIMHNHTTSPTLIFPLCFVLEQFSNEFLYLLNFLKGHACLGMTPDRQAGRHCFHSRMVHQRDQTTLICRAYLSVKYLIKGGCNSISHLITHTKQRPDP